MNPVKKDAPSVLSDDAQESVSKTNLTPVGTVSSFTCNACGEEFDTNDDAVTLYECADCGNRFTRETSADGDSHRCPDCNKFGAKVSEQGCPECNEGELVEGETPAASNVTQADDTESKAVDIIAPASAPSFKGPLTEPEQADLARCEQIIERGIQSFVEVGTALIEVSDRRLYRQTHATFQEYVSDKWKMTARRAYQLCEAAEVVKSLPPEMCTIVHNEGQARELARVEPEQRAEVLAEVVKETSGKPTAKAIRVAITNRTPEVKSIRVDSIRVEPEEVPHIRTATEEIEEAEPDPDRMTIEEVVGCFLDVKHACIRYINQWVYQERAKPRAEIQKLVDQYLIRGFK